MIRQGPTPESSWRQLTEPASIWADTWSLAIRESLCYWYLVPSVTYPPNKLSFYRCF
jgi:hypothetical protein